MLHNQKFATVRLFRTVSHACCCCSRLEHWQRNGYTSLNLPLEDSSDEEEEGEEEEEEGVELKYVVGDVTCPQNAGQADAIVVHCVGKFKVQTSAVDPLTIKQFEITHFVLYSLLKKSKMYSNIGQWAFGT